MATCGGYSFEKTILETIELMESKQIAYTDLELAALVGETLRKATTSQDEEIAHLKCLVEERNEELQKQRKRCPSFASLESMYFQPMTETSNQIDFLRSLNEESMAKIQKYRTSIKCSTDDQDSLSQVFQDLNTSKNDEKPSSDHCILCMCAGDKNNLDRLRRDQMQDQLTDMTAKQARIENELDGVIAEMVNTQKKLNYLSLEFSRQVAIAQAANRL